MARGCDVVDRQTVCARDVGGSFVVVGVVVRCLVLFDDVFCCLMLCVVV